jgi:hypothetical protein
MKTDTTTNTSEHLSALAELLAQLKAHLVASAGKKGTYGDYLRMLEFYRNTCGEQPKKLIVHWVDAEKLPLDPAA